MSPWDHFHLFYLWWKYHYRTHFSSLACVQWCQFCSLKLAMMWACTPRKSANAICLYLLFVDDLYQDWQMISEKGHITNLLGFTSHVTFTRTTQICLHCFKVAIYNTYMNDHGQISPKVDQVWPKGHNLPNTKLNLRKYISLSRLLEQNNIDWVA